MDWLSILSPVIGIVLTTMTVWALNWLRKYLKEKHSIVVSDEDFAVAKRVVMAVKEKALTGRLAGPENMPTPMRKELTAKIDLKEARPNMDEASVERKVIQAVAEVPGEGATGHVM